MSQVPQESDAIVDFYRKLGNRIRMARENAHMTQQDLADHLGITPTALSNYETGFRHPPPHHLFEIANVTSHPVEYFFGPTEGGPTSMKTLREGITKILDTFTEAKYLPVLFKFTNGVPNTFQPVPGIRMLPVPPEIAQGATSIAQCSMPGNPLPIYYAIAPRLDPEEGDTVLAFTPEDRSDTLYITPFSEVRVPNPYLTSRDLIEEKRRHVFAVVFAELRALPTAPRTKRGLRPRGLGPPRPRGA